MKKLRTYTFIDGEDTKTIEALSYRKAVRSFQGGSESKVVRVEWEAKKGGEYEKIQTLPLGRKIRQAAIIQAKKDIAKAKIGK
jgi:hypothetical protein|tara:strand:- start:218 stop:466 length:249 start_codon:yes stop_codon:yes gene_type:complete